jgi:uncharacterized membrane protein
MKKALLFTNNATIKKLFSLTFNKEGIELEDGDFQNSNFENVDVVFIDSENLNDELLSFMPSQIKKVLILGKNEEKKLGFDDYIIKPFLPNDLLDLIKRLEASSNQTNDKEVENSDLEIEKEELDFELPEELDMGLDEEFNEIENSNNLDSLENKTTHDDNFGLDDEFNLEQFLDEKVDETEEEIIDNSSNEEQHQEEIKEEDDKLLEDKDSLEESEKLSEEIFNNDEAEKLEEESADDLDIDFDEALAQLNEVDLADAIGEELPEEVKAELAPTETIEIKEEEVNIEQEEKKEENREENTDERKEENEQKEESEEEKEKIEDKVELSEVKDISPSSVLNEIVEEEKDSGKEEKTLDVKEEEDSNKIANETLNSLLSLNLDSLKNSGATITITITIKFDKE